MAEEEEQTGYPSATLEHTSTWAVAVVFFVLVSISILLEYIIHLSSKRLGIKRESLNKALYKIKSELMVLGFVSLLLTVTQGPITKICIPKSAGESFLPCAHKQNSNDIFEEPICKNKGKISLLSRSGLEQLQMFIFVLALFHVLACMLTFGLGIVKMKSWKLWEEETRTFDYQFTNDQQRFRLSRETSFARRHLKFWSNHHILHWPACFMRQFFESVSKTDYFILRHGFIMAHFAETSVFDFQKFLSRAVDDDFQVVVGVSLRSWIYAVLFIFFNSHGFYNYYWLPIIPLVILLLVGTKLQVIITKMCIESYDQSTVVRGTLLVKPNDNLFWFSRPRLLLHLMHFILFQNSFQLALFAWTWYKYGFRSCFHKDTADIVISLVVGVSIQFLCGYVTLPLYALVTQMGSSMKKAVFTKRVIEGLKAWHTTAKRNVDARKTNPASHTSEPSTLCPVEYSLSDIEKLEKAKHSHSPIAVKRLNAELMEEEKVQTSDY